MGGGGGGWDGGEGEESLGGRLSKVPVTYQARSHILNSKFKNRKEGCGSLNSPFGFFS